MKAKLRDCLLDVRTWCGSIPIGTTVYVALENLNSALLLADAQLNREIDEARRDPAGYGRNGLEDF